MLNPTERLSRELLLRYLGATLVTWIAAAGAQLVVRTDFIWGILALSLCGAPVSLYLRLHGMRVAGYSIARPLWNSFTVLLALVVTVVWTISSLSNIIALVMSGASTSFWLRFGAEGSLGLLMQVFLLFAAFRSFALISDKDATLAAVPSFSVLLLLIPVHHGIEVVLYFLAWTLVAAVLFALDHRAELRSTTNGRVPAVLPGQDVRLAARSLATVLGASLFAAFSISYFLTARNADARSQTETAITGLAGRLAQFAMPTSESSFGGGPERQIDFASGLNPPSRAALWHGGSVNLNGKVIRPAYYRLFTLSRFNGSTWAQATGQGRKLTPTLLKGPPWPLSRRYGDARALDNQPRFSLNAPSREFPRRRTGFELKRAWPKTQRSFGGPTRTVRVAFTSLTNNIGFAPLLPGTSVVGLRDPRRDEVNARSDGGLDLGFIPASQKIGALCEVPLLAEYGFAGGTPPGKEVAARPTSPRLSPQERAHFLQLPPLSQRVRAFARRSLASAEPGESNLRRATRLAFSIQHDSTYTLRPPVMTEGGEATDFFLFDGRKRGYCTHFASSLAVLCRTQNIPARVVSGFAVNEYNERGEVVIRAANAHAWTEVWIENWGWALVDATPAVDRGDNAPNFLSYWADWAGFALNHVETWSRGRALWLGVGLVFLVTAIYLWRRRARWALWLARRRGPASEEGWARGEVVAAYERAASQLARHFRPRAAWETPDEWLAAANEFTAQNPRSWSLPRRDLELLTRHYLQARYAPIAPENSVVEMARQTAAGLKWKTAPR